MLPFAMLVPLFLAGYFANPLLFWLHWLAFARLCFLYQTRRQGRFVRDFLLPCWVLSAVVYAGCLAWINLHETPLYLMIVLIFSFFFPAIFLLHHLLTLKVRSTVLQTAVMFGVFLGLEYAMSQIPAMESIGADFFFQPPAPVLCVLKLVNFKVWSAWIFALCFAVACAARDKKIRSFTFPAVLFFGLAGLVLFAHFQERHSQDGTGRTSRIALVQTNLPYEEEWRAGHFERVQAKYREMALKAAQGSPDLIIFPLYNLPGDIYREPGFLKELAALAKCPVLVAGDAPVVPGDEALDRGFMKFAFIYTPDGKLLDKYQAVEAIPFTNQDVKKADAYRVIQGPFGKLGVLICDEDMVPRLAQQAAREGAQVLVALSNPGLFQRSPILYYHLSQDQIRAAENGLPLVRVSANGYSAFIDKTGKIVQRTELDTEDILQITLFLGSI